MENCLSIPKCIKFILLLSISIKIHARNMLPVTPNVIPNALSVKVYNLTSFVLNKTRNFKFSDERESVNQSKGMSKSTHPRRTVILSKESIEPTQITNHQYSTDGSDTSQIITEDSTIYTASTEDFLTSTKPPNFVPITDSKLTSTIYNHSSTAKSDMLTLGEKLSVVGVVIIGLIVVPVVIVSIEKNKCKNPKNPIDYYNSFANNTDHLSSSVYLNESFCE